VHLVAIRIRGFKSFARVTELAFEPGVAVVIGPNGSGKSNLAEAVMWCLGEQSPTSLRGASMQDVIFAGSDGRRAAGLAEVELVFNNSNGELPLPTPQVSVGRRVTRDGETRYSINRSTCRLADILELMSGVGLGKVAHAVIGQGRVEWFLASKPEDRRAMIEEAAGLGRFKRRRERSQLKLRETSRNLERIGVLERELGSRLTPLRRQASAAEQLRQARAELEGLRGRLLTGDLEELDAELRTRRAAFEAAVARRTQIEQELAGLEQERARQEERFERMLEERERRQQRALRARVLLGRVESCARLTDQRARLLGELTRASEAERDRLLAELGGPEEERAGAGWEDERVALEEAVGQTEAAHRDVSAALAAGRRQLSERRAAHGRLAAEREDAMLRAARLGERRAAMDREAADIAHKAVELEREVLGFDQAAATAQAAREEATTSASTAAEALREAAAAASAARERQAEAERRLREARAALASAEAEHEQVSASVASLREVDEALDEVRTQYPGLAGVAESLRCDEGYERALGAALASLQSGVVVPEGVDAWTLLAALKKAGARLVRLMLPGDGPGKAAGAAVAAEAVPGGDALAGHVHGAPQAVRRLLARTVVVDDLTAVPASFGGLAVTRDGGFYAPSEGQLGLATAIPAAVLLERRARLETLGRRLVELREALEAAQASERASAETADGAAARRRELEREEREVRSLTEQREREARAATERAAEVRALLTRQAREREALEAESGALAQEVEDLERRAAELLVEQEGAAAPVAEAEEQLPALEEAHDQALAALTRARVELDERAAAAERARRAHAEQERRRREGRERLEVLEARLNALPPVFDVSQSLAARFDSLRELAGEIATGLGEAQAQGAEMDRDVLRRLADSEAALRHENDELAEVRAVEHAAVARLEERRADVGADLEQVSGELEQAHFAPPADAGERQQLLGAVERVQKRIERVGPVNPLAEAECAELDERAGFLREQRRDLERSLTELEGLIRDLTARIDSDFDATFEVIRGHFVHMIETLFPGGKGDLVLSDGEAEGEERGVTVQIKPGRKLGKRLSMLSGGERALAAIAFLMALVLANPAPFYILDEVEAALDDVNIGRFVDLVREYHDRTQFVIITHQKRTMEAADLLYGVTMSQDGVSQVVSARMAEEAIDRAARERAESSK
jgi:chromosome segregation protein